MVVDILLCSLGFAGGVAQYLIMSRLAKKLREKNVILGFLIQLIVPVVAFGACVLVKPESLYLGVGSFMFGLIGFACVNVIQNINKQQSGGKKKK